MRIRFGNLDGFFKIHSKIRYLVLVEYSYCDKICDKIKYLIIERSGITDSINHNLDESELLHMILYLLIKYSLFIML